VLQSRSRIIFIEPPRDAAPTTILMFNIGRLSEISQAITVSYCSHSSLYQFKSEEKIATTLMLTFACFKEVGWVPTYYGRSQSRIKIFTRSRINMVWLRNTAVKYQV
jgi:hypothetical protein